MTPAEERAIGLVPARPALRAGAEGCDSFPLLERAASTQSGGCLFESEPEGFAAEQFRLMQRKLTNARPAGGCLLVTSPGPNDGKSLNARNLAWAFAEAERPTLLLELDLRRPSQCDIFSARLKRSVEDVLEASCEPREATCRIEGTQLHYLGLSRPAKNPIGLLRSSALLKLLEWSRRNFQWIVMDVPPVLSVSDVEELVPHADLVLMIVRERVTPLPLVRSAAERLGKRLNYVIFNDVKKSAVYGYGYLKLY